MKADIPNRTYYKIGEVASILGVKPHIVRYWAEEFPQIRLQKTKSGQRLFTRRDIDLLRAIERLVIGQEYTVSGAKTRLQLLKDIGVESDRLYETIERLQDDATIARIVKQSLDPQGQLNFEAPQNTADASSAHTAADAESNDALKQELESLQRALNNAKEQQAASERTWQKAYAEKERAWREENDALKTELQSVRDALQAERDVQKRRQDLSRKSLEEERQFYADEQHILTLYIEELEESLYQAKEEAKALQKQLDTQNDRLASVQSDVRRHAMQRRYALRKAHEGAKSRQRQAHAHLRVLAERLQQRAHSERQHIGQSARNDSD